MMLPQADPLDADALGMAYFLFEEFQKRLKVSVQNAIADAFPKGG